MSDGYYIERSVDEINAGVREALSHLDGGGLKTISHLTGISIGKLIELGAVHDIASPEERRDRPGIPGPGPAGNPGDRP